MLEHEYPLETEDFLYTTLGRGDIISMVSGYNKTTESMDRDLIELLATFSPIQWLYVWAVLTVFSVILFLARKHVYGHKRPESIWIVSMFYLDQDYLDEVTFFLKILSIAMSFFSFFTMQYMQNSANTDLVTKKDPIAVKSFQDILERPNVKVFWFTGSLKQFKFAPEGSIERKLWDRKSDPSGSHLIDATAGGSYLDQMTEILWTLKGVVINNKVQLRWATSFACKSLRERLGDLDINVLKVFGTQFPKEFMVAFPVSKNIDPDVYRRLLIGYASSYVQILCTKSDQ